MTLTAEIVLKKKAILGEGPIWCHKTNRLFWVDIINQSVNRFDPETSTNRVFNIGQDVGCIVPRESGGFVVALRTGFAHFDPNESAFQMLSEQKTEGIRFNDGKCDPAGRFWVGTIADDIAEGAASLYCLETDLTLDLKIQNVTISNGLAWSADHQTMYYIDTPTSQVVSYDYDIESGGIANPQVAIEIDPQMGMPDGMTIDQEGMLFIALWAGGKVARFNPNSGNLMEIIEIPSANQVTSCTFGGPKLDELFITTARLGLSDDDLKEQTNAGNLFKIQLNVKGTPSFQFRG